MDSTFALANKTKQGILARGFFVCLTFLKWYNKNNGSVVWSTWAQMFLGRTQQNKETNI